MGGEGKTAFGLHFKVKFANMNKVNYQKILEQTIEKNERENRVPTLLLHSCCAPCSSYCLEYLSNYFKITVFYYNPNIYPEEEYRKRVAEQQKFIEKLPVMERHPEVYLKLVGVLDESGMEPVQNRIEKLPFMDWRQLPAVIAGLDINLMPLENSLFHWCKSENKWTEAALVKVPSVMSRNCEMEYVVENGKDGWMCTTKEEWVNALEALVTDEKARKAMGETAHQKVMEHYLTVNTGKDAMEELLCSESYTK